MPGKSSLCHALTRGLRLSLGRLVLLPLEHSGRRKERGRWEGKASVRQKVGYSMTKMLFGQESTRLCSVRSPDSTN